MNNLFSIIEMLNCLHRRPQNINSTKADLIIITFNVINFKHRKISFPFGEIFIKWHADYVRE